MNEEVPIEQPAVETPAAPTPAEQPELTLAEHEQQFPSEKMRPPERRPDGAPETTETPAETAQQKRDKETGQFAEGKTRQRAKSQQAGARDVPRINELTRRNHELEEELNRLRQTNGNGHAVTPAAPVVQPPAQQPPQQTQQFRAETPANDPEPQENDPRYNSDLVTYLKAHNQWAARDAIRQNEFQRYVVGEQTRVQQAELAENRGFAERVQAAQQEYADFEEVAFNRDTPIRKDTIPDIFIRKDDNGPRMLYYLHAHRQELDELLKMDEFRQTKFMTLLSQRLSPNGSGSAGAPQVPTMSAAPPRTIVLPPKPANIVRTEAQRTSGGMPTDRELTLAEHEQFYPGNKRR